MDDFHDRSKAFVTWLQQKGVYISTKVQLADFRAEGRGRGVVASADLGEDELLFSIPRSAVLNIKTADNKFPGYPRNAEEALSSMPSWLSLTAIMIAQGQKEDSFWAPYLAILPNELDSLVFWSDLELAELQASTIVHKIGKAKAEESFAESIVPLGLSDYSIENCHKIASIIMAYAFDVPDPSNDIGSLERSPAGDDYVSDDGEDEKIMLSMIPLADMLNADADRNNARLSCDNEDLEMRSTKCICKGEEILNDYGQLPSSDLCRRYGYVTERYAQYDVVELPTQLILSVVCTKAERSELSCIGPFSEDDTKVRTELAKREGIFDSSYDIQRTRLEEDIQSIPDELLALLYLFLLDDSTLSSMVDNTANLPRRSKLVTEAVGNVLIAILRERERQYPTSVEDDEILLQDVSLSLRQRMAIHIRLGEKQLLRDAVKEAQMLTASSTASGNYERMQRSRRCHPDNHDMHNEMAPPDKRARLK